MKAGQINVFAAVDNLTRECLWVWPRHKIWVRHEAPEPIRQAEMPVYGKYDAEVVADLCLLHYHGRHHFQAESTFLRIYSSLSSVRRREGHEIIEPFFLTLEE